MKGIHKNRVVFIAGTGHCGSTLLDLILSSNSKTFGLGEIESLGNNPGYFSGILPICNINGFEDSFWKRERVEHVSKYFQRRSWNEKIVNGLRLNQSPRARLFKYLFLQTGANVLVDSSKNANWIKTCLSALGRSKTTTVHIYLTRDGRAVINSNYQKYPERGIEKISDQWLSKIEGFRRLYQDFDGLKTVVSYEQFTSKPKKTIESLCDLIPLQFEENMLEFWKHDHHNIGGNSGTKSMIGRYRSIDELFLESLDSRKKECYSKHPLTIKEDLRWKDELSDKDLKYIDSKISHLNLHYGI